MIEMKRLSTLVVALVVTAIMSISGAVQAQSGCTSTDPTAPCFADNDDILAGQRQLLPDDDLVLNAPQPMNNNTAMQETSLLLDTANLAVSSATEYTPIRVPCFRPPPNEALSHVRAGRLFPIDHDVVVTLAPSATATGSACNPATGTNTNLAFYVHDPQDSSNDSTAEFLGNTAFPTFALGDFNKDGNQDIFFLNQQFGAVWTAADPSTPSAGLAQQSTLDLPSKDYTPQGSLVVADFNEDGVLDIAWPGADGSQGNGQEFKVRFASVCPAANATVLGQTCGSAFEIVFLTQTIGLGVFTNVGPDYPVAGVTLAAGNFDGSVNPLTGIADAELLVAATSGIGESGSLGPAFVSVYTLDANFGVTEGPNSLGLDGTIYTFTNPTIASGQIDWDSQQEEAVLVTFPDFPRVSVITFSPIDLTMTQHTLIDENQEFLGQPADVVVGRFDPPDTSSGTDTNLQIAVLYEVGFASTPTQLRLYSVDAPSSFTPTLVSLYSPAAPLLDPNYVQLQSPLQVADLQGRSLPLGEPSKVSVTHIQPDIILGMPPQHVDFIPPSGGGAPEVVNVSVFPATFNAAYKFSASENTQSTQQSTTSYTVGTQESANQSISYGIPYIDQVSINIQEAAKQTHETTVSQTYDTYSSTSYSFSAATQFDDKVGATSQQINTYSYPVIGQMVCPDDSPNCPDDCSPGTSPCPMVQMTVQYTGPDNVVHLSPADASGLEWYQPANEPGNLFSYPGNLALLEAAASTNSLQLLTPSDEIWSSLSTEAFSVDWTQGGGSDLSSGSTNTNSWNVSVSVSGDVSFEGVGAGLGGSFDYQQSDSMSTVNTSKSTFDASTGVTLNRGGIVGATNSNEFLYEGQTYIFGQLAPVGTIDTNPPNTDVQTQGYLQVGHVADMLSTETIQSGAWWKQAYTTAPDVALNRPERWAQKTPLGSTGQQVHYYCPIGFTADFGTPSSDPGSCTPTSEVPNTTNVADAPFYQMKGLFVTPGTSADGPSAASATLGDVLTLQARVYNYSLANMPDDTQVYVQFYAQPWDSTTGEFAGGSEPFGFAEAVYIGEDMLAPIPAFCGGSQGAVDPCLNVPTEQNWVLAQAQWDTSTLSPQPSTETDWKFWVVVWMEDSSGTLVSEIAEHGLTGIPGTNLGSLAEVPVETYSNNLGFYNQVFSLELPTAGEAAAPAAGAEPQEIAIRVLDASNTGFVPLGSRKVFRFEHQATGGRLDHLLALLYEGDPDQGGRLLDVDIIPHIPAGGTFVVPFPYVPRTCGVQSLFVRTVPRDGGRIAEAALDVFAAFDPVAQTRLLIERVESLGLKRGTERSLLAKLEAAERSFQRGNQKAGLNQLNAFVHKLGAQSGKKIPSKDATQMIARVADLKSCL